ncbi:hypothetical protein [Mucilaginibacter rubeus]|uniref:hypothetical protein n=1 Tax=Mucilaginibacter rubeus TaxID=2027860 RepID=UPI001664D08E|nr:hypothetical protein [Mucilaginibacter rubeus]
MLARLVLSTGSMGYLKSAEEPGGNLSGIQHHHSKDYRSSTGKGAAVNTVAPLHLLVNELK